MNFPHVPPDPDAAEHLRVLAEALAAHDRAVRRKPVTVASLRRELEAAHVEAEVAKQARRTSDDRCRRAEERERAAVERAHDAEVQVAELRAELRAERAANQRPVVGRAGHPSAPQTVRDPSRGRAAA